MATSQNDWPVFVNAPPPVWVVPDILKLRVCPGDVAYLFTDLATEFHNTVERVDEKVEEIPGYDDWGWNNRNVRNSNTTISNHASGTAIDLNATKHPQKERGTFTNAQMAQIRRILDRYRDPLTGSRVIRWGGDFSTTVDEMHWEINAEPAAITRVANMIRAIKEDEMALDKDDVLPLGEGNAVLLRQPDKRITVGEALTGAFATGVANGQKLDALLEEQKETNDLLRQLVNANVIANNPNQ